MKIIYYENIISNQSVIKSSYFKNKPSFPIIKKFKLFYNIKILPQKILPFKNFSMHEIFHPH